MKSLIQRMTILTVFFLALGIATSRVPITAQPNLGTPIFLPFIPNQPTWTPTATVIPGPILLGPVGSSEGGTAFRDYPPDYGKVVKVSIHAGIWIDNLQMILNTGALPSHGGSGGDPYEVTLGLGEYIVEVSGHAGVVVDQIYFRTNLRTYGPYGGGGGDTVYVFTAPPGYEIAGFWGNAGDYFDHLGVVARWRQ